MGDLLILQRIYEAPISQLRDVSLSPGGGVTFEKQFNLSEFVVEKLKLEVILVASPAN